jgi:hypothetical protein
MTCAHRVETQAPHPGQRRGHTTMTSVTGPGDANKKEPNARKGDTARDEWTPGGAIRWRALRRHPTRPAGIRRRSSATRSHQKGHPSLEQNSTHGPPRQPSRRLFIHRPLVRQKSASLSARRPAPCKLPRRSPREGVLRRQALPSHFLSRSTKSASCHGWVDHPAGANPLDSLEKNYSLFIKYIVIQYFTSRH